MDAPQTGAVGGDFQDLDPRRRTGERRAEPIDGHAAMRDVHAGAQPIEIGAMRAASHILE